MGSKKEGIRAWLFDFPFNHHAFMPPMHAYQTATPSAAERGVWTITWITLALGGSRLPYSLAARSPSIALKPGLSLHVEAHSRERGDHKKHGRAAGGGGSTTFAGAAAHNKAAQMTGNAPSGSGAVSSYFGNKIWGMRVVDLRLLWTLEIRDVIFSFVARYFKMKETLESNRLKHVVKRIVRDKSLPMVAKEERGAKMPRKENASGGEGGGTAETVVTGSNSSSIRKGGSALDSSKDKSEIDKVLRRATASNRRASLNSTSRSSSSSSSSGPGCDNTARSESVAFERKDNKTTSGGGVTTPVTAGKARKICHWTPSFT